MRYYAATIQTNFPAPVSRKEIGNRCNSMCNMIEQTVLGYEPFFDVRLFVLPEFGHQVPIYPDAKQLHAKIALELPNKHTDKYHKLCKKYGIYIQTASFLERDNKYPGHVFNTTLLIGPTGILSKYRKVNTWIPWEVHTSPADLPGYDLPLFPVVDTELGKLGVAICYDWLFPECIKEMLNAYQKLGSNPKAKLAEIKYTRMGEKATALAQLSDNISYPKQNFKVVAPFFAAPKPLILPDVDNIQKFGLVNMHQTQNTQLYIVADNQLSIYTDFTDKAANSGTGCSKTMVGCAG